MTAETPAQARAADKAGIEALMPGTDAVGAENGGPGLPVKGMEHHRRRSARAGLQALILFGYLLALFAPAWLRTSNHIALVWTADLLYLCFHRPLTWQALHGQPVSPPSFHACTPANSSAV